ncbi:aquaporin-9-like isoform X2 [Oppia nitens]|nr:aquaporin-9-like isoform X2 [Oppia nitens]
MSNINNNNNNNNSTGSFREKTPKTIIISKMRQLIKEMMAEMLGTFMLMLIGCSACCAYSLNLTGKPDKSVDGYAVNFCWGFGAFIGICASMAISGGHINPAVSVAFATLKRFPWAKVGPYIGAQLVGAFLGTAVSYLVYYEPIGIQHNLQPLLNHTELRAYGHSLSTGGFFATYPAAHSTLLVCIIEQIVATCSLLISVMVVVDKNNLNVPMYLQPFLLAFVIATHAQVFSFNTGCAMNPARDLGPRLFTAIAGWGIHVFSPLGGHYWWAVGVLASTIGATMGVWIYYYVIEYFYTTPEPVNPMLDDCAGGGVVTDTKPV